MMMVIATIIEDNVFLTTPCPSYEYALEKKKMKGKNKDIIEDDNNNDDNDDENDSNSNNNTFSFLPPSPFNL